MKLQVGVKVFLQNSEGKYLLLKRSPEKYPEVERPWDIPGGRIEPGTPLADNLAREVREETGLLLTSTAKLIFAQDILKSTEKHVVRLTYTASVAGEPVLGDDEHTEYKWYTVVELQHMKKLDEFAAHVVSEILAPVKK